MENEFQHLAHLDRIIHEPMRLMIVALLASVEQLDYLYLLRETGMTKGNLSAHLTKLEDAGYIAVQKTFRGKIPQTLYTLTETGLQAFRAYQEDLKRVLHHPATSRSVSNKLSFI